MYNVRTTPDAYADRPRLDHRYYSVDTSTASTSQGYPSEITPTSPPQYSQTPPADQDISKTLRWIPPPPQQPYQNFPRLERIVAIPQIEPNSLITGVRPFHRAYAPCLEQHAVTIREFTDFIDNLSIAQGPNPVIQAAQVTGAGLGFVPEPLTQFTSLGISIAAEVAASVTSTTRTNLYLKKVNADYFEPRGLKASIVKNATLRSMVGEGALDPPMVPVDVAAGFVTIAERRMQALKDRIAPLNFNVPPPETPQNTIDRLSSKQLHSRLEKNRFKAVKKRMQAEIKKEKKKEKEEEKQRKKEEKRMDKGESGAEKASERKKAEYKTLMAEKKAEDKEKDIAEKLKWVIVENL